MRIRYQLLALSLGSAAIFLSAVAVYFWILAPLTPMKTEYGYILELSRATADLNTESSRLLVAPVETQGAVFQASVDRYAAANDAMTKIVYLSRASAAISDALKSVTNLKALADTPLQKVTDRFATIKRLAERFLPNAQTNSGSNTDPADYSRLVWTVGTSAETSKLLVWYQLAAFRGDVNALGEVLKTISAVLEEKDNLIAAEMANIESFSKLVALLIIVLSVLLSLFISLIVAQRIARSMSRIERNLGLVRDGDLTIRQNQRTRNEVGHLSRDLDKLLESLDGALGKVRVATAQNLVLRDELVEIVNEAAASSYEIETNSAAIQHQMQNTDSMVTHASKQISAVVEAIAAFQQKLGSQNHHVGMTVGSVTEMMESIANIGRIAEYDRGLVESLVKESDRGREVFEDSAQKVADIASSISAIQEMAAVVAEIAAQTSILAMNAAIEAAHAGDYGKGFAVVAEEIRRLADASATSSDEITHNIRDIIVKIKEAGETRDITNQTFDTITSQIRDVSKSVGEIYGNVNGMQVGSHQILESMESLKKNSSEITSESGRIEHSVADIQKVMDDLNRVSNEVTSNITEIVQGMTTITESFHQVSAQTAKIGGVGEDLSAAVETFKISGESDGGGLATRSEGNSR